jgi:hypothetical protein
MQPLFAHSDGTIVFLLFFLFGQTVLAWAYMVSAFFSKAKVPQSVNQSCTHPSFLSMLVAHAHALALALAHTRTRTRTCAHALALTLLLTHLRSRARALTPCALSLQVGSVAGTMLFFVAFFVQAIVKPYTPPGTVRVPCPWFF